MKTYIFKTVTTMKEYNNKKWWIDSDIIREIKVNADNVAAALVQYAEKVKDKFYIDISRNAIKNKSPMYIDTPSGEAKQIGYVITGKTDFQRDSGEWVAQYIDLWVSVLTVIDTDFEEE